MTKRLNDEYTTHEKLLDDFALLGIALTDLHDACKFWKDQQDPVLANARTALRNAGYDISEPD